MRPLKRARPLAVWLLAAVVLACSCSGRDVSLGEDLHPTPKPSPTPLPAPIPVPIPIPEPIPSPTPTDPCELEHEGTCLVSTEPCSGGRFVTQAGYECRAGTACCVVRGVGTGAPGSGGTSNMDTAAGGVGGQ